MMIRRGSAKLSPVLSLVMAFTAMASGLGKKEIDLQAHDRWKTVLNAKLSNDGRWIAYSLASPKGSAELVVRSVESEKEFRVPQGLIPQGDSVESGLKEHLATYHRQDSRRAISITSDSRSVVFGISTVAGQLQTNQQTLGILQLPSGRVEIVPGISSFVLPDQSTRYMTYRRNAVLVLRDLATGDEVAMRDVETFAFDQRVRYLAYTICSEAPENNGVYVRRLSDGKVAALLSGPGEYRSLTFDRSGEQVAFLSTRAESGRPHSRFALYHSAEPMAEARVIVSQTEVPGGMRISDRDGVRFTDADNGLIVTIGPVQPKPRRDAAEPKQVNLELWRWNDSLLPRQQNSKRPSYLAIYDLELDRLIQLASEGIPTVVLSADARHAMGFDIGPYALANRWAENKADVYLVDTKSGTPRLWRRAMTTGLSFPNAVQFSPGGRFLLYFENRRWFSYDLARQRAIDLTGSLLPEVRFDIVHNTRAQTRRPAVPHGAAGWTANDERVWLYAEHDIWEFDPAGVTAARNLTRGLGQKNAIQFRVWPDTSFVGYGSSTHFFFGRAERRIDATTSVMLTAYQRDPPSTGLWRLDVGARPMLEPLLTRDRLVTLLAQARDTSQYLLSQESYNESPDLWTGSRLDRLTKVSNANPQQAEYNWGTTEIIRFTSSQGVPLQGVLYKPEDFDPSKKYPLIVNNIIGFAVGVSQLPLVYDPPSLDKDPVIYSPARYVSKGYLVFTPDIEFAAPYPGESALGAVASAVQWLVDRGFVDAARVGLTGHSWGGYMANYVVTHTHLFRCAVSGAGTANTISSYSGLMGGSPFMFEKGIYLHNASIWENPFLYLVNSPLLYADRVSTSLLIMHNENDEGTPFAQAIELFVGLRRNGKEVYLFNYRDEGHNLFRYANQRDWDDRKQQFLDHCLKNAPAPSWMVHGTLHE